MAATAKLDSDVKDVILEALGREYVAFNAGVETGNHYQSIDLGDVRTGGFRDDRGPLLDQIDFKGKKVLDLGSNLGELSRETRARGAYLVDGFEFDPYFVEIADLINAYTETTRVSFFQRDISNPASYANQYDIVLAFSVFGQGVQRCLERVSETTDVLVVETHKLEGNFDAQYMRTISRYFPSYRIIGQSDWGSVDSREVRAVAVFAKDQATLSATLRTRNTGRVSHSVEKEDKPTVTRFVDVARTHIHTTFFSHYAFDSPDELLAAVDTTEVDLDSLVQNRDIRQYEYRGWVFWFLYLKGYCQYSKSKEVGPGNVYYDYLLSYHNTDPVLSSRLEHPEKTVEHVTRQFLDMDRCRFRESDKEAAETIQPIHVVLAERPLSGLLRIFERGRPAPLPVKLLDGWHRLFGAKVFGVPALRCVSVDESGVGPILGTIEAVHPYDGGLEIRGWCLDPRGGRIDRFGVDTDEKVLPPVDAVIGERPDVQAAFPHLPHALRSGFTIRCECHPERVEKLRLEITVFGDWHAPVGKINLRYAAGMFDDLPSTPAALAQRLYGTADPSALALRSRFSVRDLVEPIKRFRSLNSFHSVLDFGCGTGVLEQSMRRFLPAAEVTAVEFDREAIEWCHDADLAGAAFLAVPPAPPSELPSEAFDLVLASSAFPRLDRKAQAAWLEELHRVMKSEGYAAVTVLGELALEALGDPQSLEDLDRDGISDRRLQGSSAPSALSTLTAATYQTRSYTVELCERWFDVIGYAEGAVANQQDLIVLRRREL